MMTKGTVGSYWGSCTEDIISVAAVLGREAMALTAQGMQGRRATIGACGSAIELFTRAAAAPFKT